jgi:prepilin-type N-terminal cleavage/methylation domain-containing protein
MIKNSKAGFTLVELMVVAIIVAILAAVAIPLMTAQKKRAMATEGEAGLGMLRTSLRAMYAETGFYNRTPNGGATPVGAITNLPGVNASDLNGKYFQSTDYRLTAVGDATYTLQVTGSTQDVVGVTITLDQAGTFNRSGL